MGTYQLFAAGGPPIGAMMTKPPRYRCRIGVFISTCRRSMPVSRITAGGGKILNGPMEVPGGQWVVQAMDPQGAPFNLVAPQR